MSTERGADGPGTLRGAAANSLMLARWQRVPCRARALVPPLAQLMSSALVSEGDAVVLEPLLGPASRAPAALDPTGLEAFVNKIHLGDYVPPVDADEALAQGVLFAEGLAARLAMLRRPCRVFLAVDLDSDDVTVRFFLRREGQPWSDDDLEAYREDAVAQWDVG